MDRLELARILVGHKARELAAANEMWSFSELREWLNNLGLLLEGDNDRTVATNLVSGGWSYFEDIGDMMTANVIQLRFRDKDGNFSWNTDD